MNELEMEIVKWIVTGVLGLAMWFGKRTVDEMSNDIKALNKDLQDFKQAQSNELQHVRQSYLHRDDFKEFKVELRQMFEEIKNDLRSFKDK